MGLGDKLKSFFRRSTRGSAALSAPQFQLKVLEIVNKEFPDLRVESGPDTDRIKSGDFEFGLQNLYARYLRAGASVNLEAMVNEHFSHLLANVKQVLAADVPSWDTVQTKLRPQFMPLEYQEQIPILALPFHSGIAIAIVIDEDHSYSYVRRDYQQKWNLSDDQIYKRSLENLYISTAGVEIHSGGPPDRYIGIEAGDGYDAARLLIPEIRSKAVDKLGEPFLAGIPNRDFLIMWALDCTQHFHDYAYEKVRNDFEMQPYPLTPNVFQVTRSLITPSTSFN